MGVTGEALGGEDGDEAPEFRLPYTGLKARAGGVGIELVGVDLHEGRPYPLAPSDQGEACHGLRREDKVLERGGPGLVVADVEEGTHGRWRF
jgi:hypothetical protein